MARLGIYREFLWEFGTLHSAVLDKVADVFATFANATHPGVHLEKISGVRDPAPAVDPDRPVLARHRDRPRE